MYRKLLSELLHRTTQNGNNLSWCESERHYNTHIIGSVIFTAAEPYPVLSIILTHCNISSLENG